MTDAETRFRCVTCGKLTAGRMPRVHGRHQGDTSARYPRRHNGADGKPCAGNVFHAEWVDVYPDGVEVVYSACAATQQIVITVGVDAGRVSRRKMNCRP